jgi:integrase
MTVNHLSLSIQLGRRIPASDSSAISKYIKNISTMNKSTAYMYFTRLSSFKSFISSAFNLQIDVLIKRIKEGSIDVFDVLNEYAAYLSNTNISSITIKQRVVTVKNFFEYYDIDISPRKFKLKVKLPKTIRKNKEALSKEDVTHILNACSDIRLKTYVMLLASTGMRAQEAVSLRIKDFHLDE